MAFLGYEGGWDSQIRQMMDKGKRGTGAVTIESATVTASAPELKVERDRDGLPLDKEDLIVAEHLTQHKRIMTFRRVTDSRFMRDYPRAFTSYVPWTNADPVDVEVEYQDGLRKGDRVILACDDTNMIYYVLDRAVIYR